MPYSTLEDAHPITVLLTCGVFLIAVVIGILFYPAETEDSMSLAEWAKINNWSWHPGNHLAPRLSFDLFHAGDSRRVYHHMNTNLNNPTPGLDTALCEMFDYQYTVQTYNKDNELEEDDFNFTCAVVQLHADLGHVLIQDECFIDRFFQSLGFDDIDLEDHEFSKSYIVKAKNRKDAYDLLGPSLMRYLAANKGWQIETMGGTMLVHADGEMTTDRCAQLAAFVGGFLAQLPRTLVNAARAAYELPPLTQAGAAARTSRERLAAETTTSPPL